MMSFNVLVKFLLSFVLFVRLCQCHGLTLLPPEVLEGRRSVSSSCRSCHSRVIHGSACKIRESHIFLWHTCVSVYIYMYTQPSYSILVSHSVQMRHSLNPRVIPRCRVISLLLRSLTIIIIIITIVIIIFVAYLQSSIMSVLLSSCLSAPAVVYFIQAGVLLA